MSDYSWPPEYEGVPLRFRGDADQEMLDMGLDKWDVIEAVHEGVPCADRASGTRELCYEGIKVVIRKEWSGLDEEVVWLVIDIGKASNSG